MKTRSHTSSFGAPGWQKGSVDADQAFVRRRGATYLARMLRRRPVLEGETLEFLSWVLGERRGALDQALSVGVSEDAAARLALADTPEGWASAASSALEESPRSARRRVLGGAHRELKDAARRLKCRRSSAVEANSLAVQQAFGLTDPERDLCLLLFLMEAWPPLQGYLDHHLNCDQYPGRPHLQAALDLPGPELARILSGRLVRTGVVETEGLGLSVGDDFKEFFTGAAGGLILGKLYRPAAREALSLDAHAVPAEVTEHLLALLGIRPRTATHVLLYAPPGTGKTSDARALLAALGVPAYEIAGTDENTFIEHFNATMAKAFRWTYTGRPLMA